MRCSLSRLTVNGRLNLFRRTQLGWASYLGIAVDTLLLLHLVFGAGNILETNVILNTCPGNKLRIAAGFGLGITDAVIFLGFLFTHFITERAYELFFRRLFLLAVSAFGNIVAFIITSILTVFDESSEMYGQLVQIGQAGIAHTAWQTVQLYSCIVVVAAITVMFLSIPAVKTWLSVADEIYDSDYDSTFQSSVPNETSINDDSIFAHYNSPNRYDLSKYTYMRYDSYTPAARSAYHMYQKSPAGNTVIAELRSRFE